MIDIDAIPLDLPTQQRPVAALYLATVEKMPDGRERVLPHYNEPEKRITAGTGNRDHPCLFPVPGSLFPLFCSCR
ncbi:MAG: hypothetical protein IMZ44_22530 [Planctomycetes bacterium]|nr:hypothetical protein [Planctomycetota bacterium]